MPVKVRFKKLHYLARIPEYKTAGAACFDLATVEAAIIPPGEWYSFATGLAFEIPDGYEMQVRPRSGLSFKTGLTFKNTIGTIDSDYRGEVRVCLLNAAKEPVMVNVGDRIAQGKISVVPTVLLIESKDLETTERGENGFGSTGSRG